MKRLLYIALLFPVFVHAQSISIFTPAPTICHSSPVLFTAFPAGIADPHYKWEVNSANAGTDSSRFVYSPANGDSIVCLLTNSTGGTVYATSNSIILTVNSMPNAGAITGYDTVCVGDKIFLSDSVTGGIWSESNTAATVSGSGAVTGLLKYPPYYEFLLPVDTIYYIITNTCGADTASVIITIATIPDASFGLEYAGVCTGQEVNIGGEDGIPPIIYKSNNNAGIDGGGYVWGNYPGLDTIYGVAYNYCGSDTTEAFVQVTAVPQIPDPSPIYAQSVTVYACATITLYDSSAGEPQWTTSNGNAVVYQNGNVTGISPGLDTITLSVLNYMCGIPITKSPSPIVITVNTSSPLLAPISGDDILCLGAKTNVSDTGNGTWSVSDTSVIFIDPYLHTVLGTGIGEATISYTYSTGCAVTKQVSVYNCMGVLTIFPDPVRNQLIIEADTTLYHSYTIFNCIGQEITHGLLTQSLTEIDTPLWPAGVYLMHLEGIINYTSRFVKE